MCPLFQIDDYEEMEKKATEIAREHIKKMRDMSEETVAAYQREK